MSSKPDGYRYIRSYRSRNWQGKRYALWQVIDGKARRVGTAHSETEYRQFLGFAS